MLGMGAYLLSAMMSVAPTLSTRAEPLASTYEQAACDLFDLTDASESGECAAQLQADPLLMSTLPPPAPMSLWHDCAAPTAQPFVGSCDLPRAARFAHYATVRNARRAAALRVGLPGQALPGLATSPAGDDLRLLPPSLALGLRPPGAVTLVFATPLLRARSARHRLDRPPRC